MLPMLPTACAAHLVPSLRDDDVQGQEAAARQGLLASLEGETI
jgi:hypothetical protein